MNVKAVTENYSQKYTHYYKYAEITRLLKGYAKDYPAYTRLEEIGTTEEGRKIWAISVTNTKTGSFEDKPAFFVEGNIHAGEVTGCMCCMFLLDVIFTNLKNKEIKNLLDLFTIYVIPRVSPDGSEHYLTTPDYVRSVNRLYGGKEDVPGMKAQDLDGDGVIRRIRVKSPTGLYKISEKDPRVMTRRAPDEFEGEFYHVYSEGLIEEFDGRNVPGQARGFSRDFNRNYPIGWEPEHKQHGAGDYPLDSPETKANADFLLAHPNICGALDMHTMGGQNLYTPGFKPSKDANRQDIALYEAIGRMAHEENGFPSMNIYDKYMPAGSPACYGAFDDFCHFILGIPGMTIECWDLWRRCGIEESYPPKETTDEEDEAEIYKFLAWFDENIPKKDQAKLFKPWTKFTHPQLGECEIGGVDYKHIIQNPPVAFLVEEMQKHVRFMLREISILPRVSFEDIKIEKLGEGSRKGACLYKVEAYLVNKGYLSTYIFKEALQLKTLKPLKVTYSGGTLQEGKSKELIDHLEGLSGLSAHNGVMGPGTGGTEKLEKKLTYIVEAKPGTKAHLACEGGRIGKVEARFTIQ